MKISQHYKGVVCSLLFALLSIQFMAAWQELSTIRQELHRAEMYQMEKREGFWRGNEKMFQFKSPAHALIWQVRN